MSVRYYDEALLDKIKNWVKDPNMKIYGSADTERIFQQMQDDTNDNQITLPLISIVRADDITINSTNKRPLTFDGLSLEANQKETLLLNAVPITIRYEINIYTKYTAEADEYMRNFVFNLINYPKLKINIPYNDSNIEYNGNITLLSPVRLNSTINDVVQNGTFTRWTIPIEISDAYLFSAPILKNIRVCETEIETR